MRKFLFRSFVCLGFCLCAIGGAAAQTLGPGVRPSDLTRDAILNDPAAPVIGDPKGDITIVAFEDYNCPFCKKADPALIKLVKDDGHIRLVFKDWPILADSSLYGAELALAANYQGKYEAAHRALMALPGVKGGIDKARMDKAMHEAGVDIARLNKDLDAHVVEIGAVLQRNDAQAKGMGFAGTPVYLIGPYLVAAAPDYAGFKKIVTSAREKARQ